MPTTRPSVSSASLPAIPGATTSTEKPPTNVEFNGRYVRTIEFSVRRPLARWRQAETITLAIETTLGLLPAAVATGGYANKFVASHSDEVGANAGLSDFRDDLDPIAYGGFVAEWLQMGATLVGGCCGMDPAHIHQIAEMVSHG